MEKEHIERMQAARPDRQPTVAEYCEKIFSSGVDAITLKQAKSRLENMNKSLRHTYTRVIIGEGSAKMRIKCFCIECMGYEKYEVAGCTDKGCPLYGARPVLQKRSKMPKTQETRSVEDSDL